VRGGGTPTRMRRRNGRDRQGDGSRGSDRKEGVGVVSAHRRGRRRSPLGRRSSKEVESRSTGPSWTERASSSSSIRSLPTSSTEAFSEPSLEIDIDHPSCVRRSTTTSSGGPSRVGLGAFLGSLVQDDDARMGLIRVRLHANAALAAEDPAASETLGFGDVDGFGSDDV
jgi:hypothetical protein